MPSVGTTDLMLAEIVKRHQKELKELETLQSENKELRDKLEKQNSSKSEMLQIKVKDEVAHEAVKDVKTDLMIAELLKGHQKVVETMQSENKELRNKLVGDTPTLLKLKVMKSVDGKPLNFINKISAKDYVTFGMYLLQDDNGTAVDLIKRDHIQDGAESVTRVILQKWLTSDAPTRTYQHLIECLRQSEFCALAELIEATFEQGIYSFCKIVHM